MKIKKLTDNITYKAETHDMEVVVNGKKVRIIDWYRHDNEGGEYDGDVEVYDEDRKLLTEEEDEELCDYIHELKDWDEGEEFDTDSAK